MRRIASERETPEEGLEEAGARASENRLKQAYRCAPQDEPRLALIIIVDATRRVKRSNLERLRKHASEVTSGTKCVVATVKLSAHGNPQLHAYHRCGAATCGRQGPFEESETR